MKPILFNTEMIRAILEGRKTVTRRVVKLHSQNEIFFGMKYSYAQYAVFSKGKSTGCECIRTPYRPGDILYVRETWAPIYPDETSNEVCGYIYKADPLSVECYDARFPNGENYTWEGRWRPSICPAKPPGCSCG